MKAIILGNGVAGTMTARTLRELDSSAEIMIISQERYPYYPRPNLIDFLAGDLPLERIFAFPADWAAKQRIEIQLGKEVTGLNPARMAVEVDRKEWVQGDKIVLATGASPLLPGIPGIDRKGVFSLRTLDDALSLLEFLARGPEVVILGGGLLGLEIGRAILNRGLKQVTVVEYFNRLLPRQLDEIGARLLQSQLEKMGLRFLLGKEAVEISGQETVSQVKFKDGSSLSAGAVVIASGIKPRLELASTAGLAVNRGVLVDDYLQTSQPGIYAAGDVSEHRGRIYGLIPAAFDQARVVAYNLGGQIKKYEGTVPANTLKIAGIFLTSAGQILPEGEGFEVLTRLDEEHGLYKKLVLKDGQLVGAIWLGSKKGSVEITRLVQARKNPGPYKSDLLADDFDFSKLNNL
ncbi:MAG TPA: FAD-dependent oxidoreductase [Candidatus Saccharicenans sp.]|nr:FAD-dependent oxidoreductase [Candidatus Saccharicenans sp.]HPP24765.1 FAD-dependent oxidoreductase [Candidatus Saccharicenans sp.]